MAAIRAKSRQSARGLTVWCSTTDPADRVDVKLSDLEDELVRIRVSLASDGREVEMVGVMANWVSAVASRPSDQAPVPPQRSRSA